MSLLFYLFTFAMNLWHWKFITADVTAVFVNNQQFNMALSDEDRIFIKKSLYLKGYTAKRLTDEFPEKSWTKRGVNKLFKKLRDTGAVDRRPGSSRPRSAHTEENAKLLLQKFPHQSATDFVLPTVRWSDREHPFVCNKNKVSGILRKLLKQKLSALHASSAVRVCQLLCTAPFETFQIQVLTNNPGQIQPMNTHRLWYLTNSFVGQWLLLLTQD